MTTPERHETRPSSSSSTDLRKMSAPAGSSSSTIYSMSDATLDIVHEGLEQLVESSHARCALVIDRTGCIMCSAGDFHPINPSTLGATAAATIAALNAMVSRAASPEVSVKFYGAEIDKIHFVLLDERLILCLLHSRHATSGSIRAAAKAFVARVAPEIEADKRRRAPANEDLVKSVNYIEDKLDQLFKDQLGG